jgi:DNA repair exonuclease SbcCD nuclease subunit
MKRLIITSDWHADWNTAGSVRYEDVRKAVGEVVEACKPGDLFLFLGDLADPEALRSHLASGLAMRVFDELDDRKVDQVWIPGNHDVVEDGYGSSTLSVLESFKVLHATPQVQVIDGVTVLSFPYVPRALAYKPEEFVESIRLPANADPNRMVVISHLNIEGIGPGSETTDMPRGRDVFLPLTSVRKRWPKALVFNGHYHRRQRFDGVHIPGSLCRLMFSEEHNEPGFLIAEV